MNKSMEKSYSIKGRLLKYILLGLSLMAILIAALVYRSARHEIGELFDASLAQSSRILLGLMSRDAIENNKAHLLESLDYYDVDFSNYAAEATPEGHKYEKKIAFQVWDKNGSLLLKSKSIHDTKLAELKAGYGLKKIADYHWRTFTIYSESDDMWITLGEREDSRQELIHDIAIDYVVPFLFIIPLLLCFVWQVTSKGIKPLKEVAKHMDNQDYQQLQAVSIEHQPAEVQSLVNAVNALFDRLNHSYDREKNFAADAAHELRNPLAALSIQTDNAIAENTDSNITPILNNIKKVGGRLSHLVKQLLTLSKVDREFSDKDWQNVNLNLLCQNVIAEFDYKAESKEQTLSFTSNTDSSVVHGIKELLISLITNLLDNAIRYTENGGEIKIHCEKVDNSIGLFVSDNGIGLSDEAKQRVMDRFYRVTGTGKVGAGIGLSVVKRVVDIHGATIELSNSDTGGLEVKCLFTGV